MIVCGDCLACSKLDMCKDTSVEKALSSYTCHLFNPVSESEWMARWTAMKRFGEVIAVKAMIERPMEESEDDYDPSDPEL